MNWSINERPLKDSARDFVAKSSKKYKKCVFDMPGSTGKCLEHLINNNVITKDTQIVLCERDKNEYGKFLSKNVIPKDFKEPTWHLGEFNSFFSDHVFDFAWFDLCGNLTNFDFQWFEYEFKITPELDLFFTFSNRPRGNEFFLICRELLTSDVDKELNRTIMTHGKMFGYLFKDYNFKLSNFSYKDDCSQHLMNVYHLSNFSYSSHKEEYFDKFEQILNTFVPQEEVTMPYVKENIKSSEVVQAQLNAKTAGTKAYATRILRDYIEQRTFLGYNAKQTEAGIKARLTVLKKGKK